MIGSNYQPVKVGRFSRPFEHLAPHLPYSRGVSGNRTLCTIFRCYRLAIDCLTIQPTLRGGADRIRTCGGLITPFRFQDERVQPGSATAPFYISIRHRPNLQGVSVVQFLFTARRPKQKIRSLGEEPGNKKPDFQKRRPGVKLGIFGRLFSLADPRTTSTLAPNRSNGWSSNTSVNCERS
jgi:hypothetical protein